MTKTLVSGIKPTGTLHIGNYFGAMRQFVELQHTYQPFVFIADLHSLTTIHSKVELQRSTFDIACAYLAIGLDPEQVILFKQSDVPEVTELAWIFNCITSVPYLERAHAFKDAAAKNTEINVGLFDYPVLMAADILMYDADVVPVGKDQKQHIEIARDIAIKFNNTFEEIFRIPEPLILKEVEVILGTDGQKMSKSYKNTIPLFGSEDEITKSVMSIKTDSKNLGEKLDADSDLVFSFHKLVSSEEQLLDLRSQYEMGSIGYGESKKLLLEKLLDYFKDAHKRYDELQKNPEIVYAALALGKERARAKAVEKINTVRKVVGVLE
ncbi:MAG: tryptophan--tRNA ligase [Candidatus Paceibacterota bacterium]